MAAETTGDPAHLLRQIKLPVGITVVAVTAAAWYVTAASSDFTMALAVVPAPPAAAPALAAFFGLLVVMMVAMMLPSALPMILAFHGLTRLEGGRPAKPADRSATAAFLVPYFLIWGAFGVAALLSLVTVGALGHWTGPFDLVSAGVLLVAGGYQMTRTKEVCLSGCQSPLSFLLQHYRSGKWGALRMGTRHALYCLGCCWLFMVALFVAGAMSLLWMGALSLVIFAEKVGTKPAVTSRAVGIALLALGALVGVRAVLPGWP